ncbi:AAA family ATPase [Paenochrobactrum sp. BZR 588]|uniref:AAA family ATPase n=1 Tax=unclassified Paenochrobactrum TaxID=2639760 RepID=UPI003851CC5F
MVAIPNTKTVVFEPGETAPELEAANDNKRGQLIFMGEDKPIVPTPELVRETLPRTGVGFFGGQSGAFKTFFSIHAATCFMTGEPLAGREIERIGGVVYLAAEGQGTIEGRLKARRSKLASPSELLPFYRLDEMGPLMGKAAFDALEERLIEADQSFKNRFDVDLVALFIDTVTAAGMIAEDKENDPGAWQKVFDRLQPIARRLGILIILIHHAGKNASAGLRGSSNARAGADFSLILACERDEITGLTKDHFLHLSKSREGAEGPIAAIHKEEVVIAHRDDGSPITTLVLNFDTGNKAPEKKARPNKTDGPFREALLVALIEFGQDVHIHGDASAPKVRAVTKADLRTEFDRRYISTHDDPAKRADLIRQQMTRAIRRGVENRLCCAGHWSGQEWVWLLDKSAEYSELTGKFQIIQDEP